MRKYLRLLALLALAQGVAKEVKLSWEPTQFAIRYDLEIYRGEKMLGNYRLSLPQWEGSLSFGTYRYRVRAIDKLARPGSWSPFQDFAIDAPVIELLAPTSDVGLSSDKKVVFRWNTATGLEKYFFSLRKVDERGNRAKVIDRELSATEIEVEIPEPGTYEWGVSPIVEVDVPFEERSVRVALLDVKRNWSASTNLKLFLGGGNYEYQEFFPFIAQGAATDGILAQLGGSGDWWFTRSFGLSLDGRYRTFKLSNTDISFFDAGLRLKYSVFSSSPRYFLIVGAGAARKHLAEVSITNFAVEAPVISAQGALLSLEVGANIGPSWTLGLEVEGFKAYALSDIPNGGKYSGERPSRSHRGRAYLEYRMSNSSTLGLEAALERTKFQYLNYKQKKNIIEMPSQSANLYYRILFGN